MPVLCQRKHVGETHEGVYTLFLSRSLKSAITLQQVKESVIICYYIEQLGWPDICFISVAMAATKIKGIYKGFKFISQIFVVKEREMEIGYPTDVKHLAHIGWEGPSATPPTWMNEFKTTPEFATAFGTPRGGGGGGGRPDSSALLNWSSQDMYGSMERQAATEMVRDMVLAADISDVSKKQRGKKKKSCSSPKSSCRPSRSASKSKASFHFQL